MARESPLALCLTHSKRAAVLPTIMVKTQLIPVQEGRWLHIGTVRKNRQVVWCEVVKGGCKLACFNSGSQTGVSKHEEGLRRILEGSPKVSMLQGSLQCGFTIRI